MIDLHCHSSVSDGELPPEALPDLAVERGLSALALTDHDTTDGIPPFMAAARGRLETIPGVEVSTLLGRETLHIVGLFIDPACAPLQAMLAAIRASREDRNTKIIRRLRHLGCAITEERVQEIAGNGVTGRPHIAAAMIETGYCENHEAAFRDYLGGGGKAYVKRYRPSAGDTISAIHQAGGVTVWAHPMGGRALGKTVLDSRLRALKQDGLDAVEADYSDHTPEQRERVRRFAKTCGLLTSGGSDFHGKTMPGIDLGIGRGDLAVPDAFLPPLRDRAKQIRAAATQ